MKKLLLILLCLPFVGFGQDESLDKMILSDGDTIFVNVVEVGLDQIIYKHQGENTHHIKKNADIAIIKYSSGRLETFKGLTKLEYNLKKQEQSIKRQEDKLKKEYEKELAKRSVENKTNILEVNLLSLFINELNLSYERVVGEKHSIRIGVPIYFRRDLTKTFLFLNPNIYLTGDEPFTLEDFEGLAYISGIGITPEYRVYLSNQRAPRGFYLASQLTFRKFSIEADFNATDLPFDSDSTASGFNKFKSFDGSGKANITVLAPLLGWQWIKGPISIDLNFGMAYYILYYKSKSEIKYEDGYIEENNDNYSGSIWLPKIGFSIGAAF
jgi:hypothetical protein